MVLTTWACAIPSWRIYLSKCWSKPTSKLSYLSLRKKAATHLFWLLHLFNKEDHKVLTLANPFPPCPRPHLALAPASLPGDWPQNFAAPRRPPERCGLDLAEGQTLNICLQTIHNVIWKIFLVFLRVWVFDHDIYVRSYGNRKVILIQGLGLACQVGQNKLRIIMEWSITPVVFWLPNHQMGATHSSDK